jgi:uncharacterized lipoprotein YmbA
MTVRKRLQILCLAIFVFAGCRSATQPVEFYTLTPLAAASQAGLADESENPLAVGVGPVEIPKINDRPQIVIRTGPNKVNVDEFHRWAGSLYEDFLRVLTINLSSLLQTNRVAAYPWEDYFDPDYQLFMAVHQFDGQLNGHVVLDVTWTLTGQAAREVLVVRKAQMKEPVTGVDFEAFVAAKSRILAILSRQIANEIKILHGNI